MLLAHEETGFLSRSMTLGDAATAGGFVLGGLLLGLIADRILAALIRRKTRHSDEEAGERHVGGIGEVLLGAVDLVLPVWFGLAGAYAAVLVLPLEPRLRQIATKLLVAIVILSATVVAARLAAGFLRRFAARDERIPGSSSIVLIVARMLVYTIGVLVVLQTLGISIAPVLTALGVGGIAVALALQDTLSNLFAGIHIIASKKVVPGDYVRLESGDEGYVLDVNWRNTSIRQLPNNVVIVPNNKLASGLLTNYYQPYREMSVLVQVGVSYDSDLPNVERVTIEVAREVMREVEGGVAEWEPFIRYHTFGDFSIGFTVILRVREAVGQYLVKHEFVKRLHARYRAEGIEIPFPIRTIIPKGSARELAEWRNGSGGSELG